MTESTIALLLTSGVIAALVAGAINLILARKHSREEERSRVRTVFAEAYAAYAEYREYPFAIYRRNPNDAANERIRLSELIRQTQQRLHYYTAWTKSESAAVGSTYSNLVYQVRVTAGGAMRQAWTLPSVSADADMSITVDALAPADISEYENAYAKAVSDHLDRLGKWWH